MNLKNYQYLVNAIILQAAEEYKTVLRKLKKNENDYDARKLKEELEYFFESDWFSFLCNIDPNWMMNQLENIIQNED